MSLVEDTKYELISSKKKQTIKKLVRTHFSSFGSKFEKGRAFYELGTKKNEIIQNYKEIIVRRLSDGALIMGESQVRKILGIPQGSTEKFKLDDRGEDVISDFTIYVQSTSHNRMIPMGGTILYRMDEGSDDESNVDDDDKEKKRRSKRIRNNKEKKSKAEEDMKRKNKRPKKNIEIIKAEENPSENVDKKKEDSKKNIKHEPVGDGRQFTDEVDVVFSFDTTGSMFACLSEVRRGIQSAITKLKREIPKIRVAVIAHGDYCDSTTSYVMKKQDFTNNEKTLQDFVRDVGPTGGGDWDECYELVLKNSRTELSWRPNATKSLVMIGDANPHPPNYPLNRENIDWKKECDLLKSEGIAVYAVQALGNSMSESFWRDLALRTGGYHLELNQFASVVNFMLAICFSEGRGCGDGGALERYDAELGSTKNRELHRLFERLLGRSTMTSESSDLIGAGVSAGLTPVPPSRFQVLHVTCACSIKEFVQTNGLIFKKGRGFYEFTKPETISSKKEVVLLEKNTGDMFTGEEACELIGAGGLGKIEPVAFKDYRVFVQSTSYNRKLVAGAGFLYEVDMTK